MRQINKSVDTVRCIVGNNPVSDKHGINRRVEEIFDDDYKVYKEPAKKVYLDELEAQEMEKRLHEDPMFLARTMSLYSYPSGIGLDLSDWNVWSKYRAIISDVKSVDKYTDCLQIRTPWNCTTSEMRQFKYMGVDVVIGYGGCNPNGYFVHQNESVTIDGYWNGFWLDMDNYQANQYIDMWIEFATGNRDLYNRNRTVMTLEYGNMSGKLDMFKLHNLMRNGTDRFYRLWIRTRHFSTGSNAEQDSENGFLYAGWDKFAQPGKEGHTFNNGVMTRFPMPVMKIHTKRFNSFEDGVVKSTAKVELSFDPYSSVWRAPESGPISQTGAKMTCIKTTLLNRKFDVRCISKGYWESGDGTNRLDMHIAKGEPGNSWYTKWYEFDNSTWCNMDQWRGQAIEYRQEITYYLEDDTHAYTIDMGYSAIGWTKQRLGTGGHTEEINNYEYYTLYTVPINDRPSVRPVFSNINIPVRYDNILYPWGQTLRVDSNATDPEGDEMIYGWKGRSKKVFDFNDPSGYWRLDSQLSDTTRDLYLQPATLLDKLYKRFPAGTNLEHSELGIEVSVYDRFYEDGVMKESRSKNSGEGWSGYKFESPIKNLKCVNTKTYPNTQFVIFDGQPVEIANEVSLKLFYDIFDGTDGKRHYISSRIYPSISDISSNTNIKKEVPLLGVWSDNGFLDLYNKWSSNTNVDNVNFTNTFKDTNHGREVRGNFVALFTGVMTLGRYEYIIDWKGYTDKPELIINSDNPSDKNYVFYVNAYPDCVININEVTYEKEGPVATCNITVRDVNKGNKVFLIQRVWITITIKGKSLTRELATNVNDNIYNKYDYNLDLIGAIKQLAPELLTQPYNSPEYATITVHSNNNYPYGTTDDGSREVNSDNSRSYTTDILIDFKPDLYIELSTNKGEGVNVTVRDRNNTGVKTVLYAKPIGTTNWTQITTSYEATPNIFGFFPNNHGFNDHDRGKDFIFAVRTKSIVEGGAEIFHEFDNRFMWNELPYVTIKKLDIVDNSIHDNGENIIWSNNCGNSIKAIVNILDTDAVLLYNYIKYGDNKFINSISSDNSPIDMNVSLSAIDINTNVSGIYPIDLTQVLSYVIQASDSFSVFGNIDEGGRFKLIEPIKRTNYNLLPIDDTATVENGVIYGIRFSVNYDIQALECSKFNDTDWMFKHILYAIPDDNPTGEFKIDEQTHSGLGIPNRVTYNVDMQKQYGTYSFTPAKAYIFKVRTLLCKTSYAETSSRDMNNIIYETYCDNVGKAVYGSNPAPVKILYPTGTNGIMIKNPPIVIQIPDQTDGSNKVIDEIGVDFGDGINWIKPGNAENYNNSIVSILYDREFTDGIHEVKLYIKSKLTSMISEARSAFINIQSNILIVNEGELITPLRTARDEVNKIRNAYGLNNAEFESDEEGVAISFNNAIGTIQDGYNEFVDKIKSNIGGSDSTYIDLYYEELILATITNKLNEALSHYK